MDPGTEPVDWRDGAEEVDVAIAVLVGVIAIVDDVVSEVGVSRGPEVCTGAVEEESASEGAKVDEIAGLADEVPEPGGILIGEESLDSEVGTTELAEREGVDVVAPEDVVPDVGAEEVEVEVTPDVGPEDVGPEGIGPDIGLEEVGPEEVGPEVGPEEVGPEEVGPEVGPEEGGSEEVGAEGARTGIDEGTRSQSKLLQ